LLVLKGWIGQTIPIRLPKSGYESVSRATTNPISTVFDLLFSLWIF